MLRVHTCLWLVQVGAWGCSAEVWPWWWLLGEWNKPWGEVSWGELVEGDVKVGVGREVCGMGMGLDVGGEMAGAR